ncbi:MAG: cobalamin biosynthesis protein CbiD, partial [Desulfobacteraceae bacterium]
MTRPGLKKGFTTGAAAAAAVKAALIRVLTQASPDQVEIAFLNGDSRPIKIHSVTPHSPVSCEARVIKDAGDDPDITHRACIGAQVILEKEHSYRVSILGGRGVGTITKPGLELEVGEPAINPGPRQMIRNSIDQVFQMVQKEKKCHVRVEIFVPDGEELAKKTMNARLGIIGGISILGTTGVVTPLSHEAYIATIRSSIQVARAQGIQTLVFTTGRRSERFAMDLFTGLAEESFIQTGDFFKASIDEACQAGIKTIIFTVFFGKACKMAMGFEHTHAAKSELTVKTLGSWAKEIIHDPKILDCIDQANT